VVWIAGHYAGSNNDLVFHAPPSRRRQNRSKNARFRRKKSTLMGAFFGHLPLAVRVLISIHALLVVCFNPRDA
jgi:hypothetical protein